MADQRVQEALQRVGEILSVVATADGAVIDARLTPDLADLNLADYALGGLAEPVPAPVDLTAVVKDVGFASPTVADAPDDATPLPNAPGLGDDEELSSPLSAVEGLLVRLTGTIGLPVDVGRVPVAADVCWTVRASTDGPGELLVDVDTGTDTDSTTPPQEVLGDHAPDFLVCRTDPDRGVFGLRSTEPTVSIPVVPPLVPMRPDQIGTSRTYELRARVRLTALGESAEVELGPLPVPVPAVPVPTVLGVFSEVGYSLAKDGAKMFIVPTDVPVDPNAAIDQLRAVQQILADVQSVGRVAGFLTGLGLLVNAVQPPVDTRHELLFKQFDQTRDLGQTAPDWRHRPFFDDHGAEDDIDSLILVSVDQQLELFEDQDFKDTKVTVTPSASLFFVAVPDFHDMTQFQPAQASVSGASNFHDEAHSLRFVPR